MRGKAMNKIKPLPIAVLVFLLGGLVGVVGLAAWIDYDMRHDPEYQQRVAAKQARKEAVEKCLQELEVKP